jgi:hypothetical protein
MVFLRGHVVSLKPIGLAELELLVDDKLYVNHIPSNDTYVYLLDSGYLQRTKDSARFLLQEACPDVPYNGTNDEIVNVLPAEYLPPYELVVLVGCLASQQVKADQVFKAINSKLGSFPKGLKFVNNYLGGWDITLNEDYIHVEQLLKILASEDAPTD